MKDSNIALSPITTSASMGMVLASLCFIGTGGSAVASSVSQDRQQQQTSVILTEHRQVKNAKKTSADDDGKAFQQLSKQLMETFGFNIKQYSEVMRVCRVTVYKWHDLNMPLAKIQSKNRNRLEKLNQALFAIKERRKPLFATWLRDPLNEDAVVIATLLSADNIDIDSILAQTKRINVGLKSLETSDELDDLLGLS